MNEDQIKSVVEDAKTQTNNSLEQSKTQDKSEQQKVANSESDTKKDQSLNTTDQSVKKDPTVNDPQEQPTQPAVSTSTEAPASNQESSPVASDAKPSEPASTPTQQTKLPKLSDVVPTSKVWISGLIGDRQIDCVGPIEIPLKIDKPTYPFTPVASNPDYTNQVFNYGTGEWVATDAKSQGQMLTDLNKEVADLQQASVKHDKEAEQSQKMSMQQMQMLTAINAKLDTLTKKDGDK